MKEKITFLSYNKLTYYGGEQKWVIDIASKLVDLGYDVEVITPDITISGEKERISIKSIYDSIKFKYTFNNKFFIRYKGFREYFTFTNSDYIYVTDFWASILQPIVSLRRAYKIIMGNHGLLFATDFRGQKYKLYLLKILSRDFKNYPNLVIHVLNSDQMKYYKNLGYRNIILLQNFIDSSKYYTMPSTNKFPILFVGRFVKQKGIDMLPEIVKYCLNMSKHENLEFWIVGSGEFRYESLIKQLARKYPHNVKYFGFISENKKIELLSQSNLFLAPSRFEGQPIAVLEALASGCPFLGSDIIAFTDLVNLFDTSFGYIVKKYTPKNFARRIIEIYYEWYMNPSKYYKKKKRISKKAKKIFDINNVVKYFVKYFLN